MTPLSDDTTLSAATQKRPRRFLLVSPPFPCGLGFIGDILLRLGIKILWHNAECWISVGGSHRLTDVGRQALTQHFAHAYERESFEFPEPVEVIYEHRLKLVNEQHDGVIFLVRDPIDAAYSNYKRSPELVQRADFSTYLDMRAAYPLHLPHANLVGGPLEIYALFCTYWRIAAERAHLVHFEAAKQRPQEIISGLLRFLGVDRSPDEIARATAGASLDKVQRAQVTDSFNTLNRRGLAFEWRERMTEDEWERLVAAEPVRTAARLLGYGRDPMTVDELLMDTSPSMLRLLEQARAMSDRVVAAEEFVRWAGSVQTHLVRQSMQRPAPDEAWWPAEILDDIASRNVALRLLADTLRPKRHASLEWHLRLWLGLAAALRRGQNNLRLRWILSGIDVV